MHTYIYICIYNQQPESFSGLLVPRERPPGEAGVPTGFPKGKGKRPQARIPKEIHIIYIYTYSRYEGNPGIQTQTHTHTHTHTHTQPPNHHKGGREKGEQKGKSERGKGQRGEAAKGRAEAKTPTATQDRLRGGQRQAQKGKQARPRSHQKRQPPGPQRRPGKRGGENFVTRGRQYFKAAKRDKSVVVQELDISVSREVDGFSKDFKNNLRKI